MDFTPTHTLEDVVPAARGMFEKLLAEAAARGLDPTVGVNGAGRTCETQAKLASMGPSVTQASLCRSWHVLGRAVDVDLHPSTCASYTELGELWESWGGTWGGRWKQFGECGDARHFQWTGGVQAVPQDVCPEGLSVEQCEQIRRDYLAAEREGRGWLWAFGLGAVVAAAAWIYSRRR